MDRILESSYYVELLELIKNNGLDYFNNYDIDVRKYYKALDEFDGSPVMLVSKLYEKYSQLFNLFKKYGKFSNRKEQYLKVQKIVKDITDIDLCIDNIRKVNTLGIDKVNLFIKDEPFTFATVVQKNGCDRLIYVDDNTYYKKPEYMGVSKVFTDGIVTYSLTTDSMYSIISGKGTITSPYNFIEPILSVNIYNPTFVIEKENSNLIAVTKNAISINNFEFNSSKLPSKEELDSIEESKSVTDYKIRMVKRLRMR